MSDFCSSMSPLVLVFPYLTLFFNCYSAAPPPRQTLGHYPGGSRTHPLLITAFLHVRPEGHWEPRNEVAALSPAKLQVGLNRDPSDFVYNALTHLTCPI